MKVDQESLEKLAHLARLKLTPGTEQEMLRSLNQMIDWVEKLGELDTEDVEPLTHLSDEVNNLRTDEPQPQISKKELLKNTPKQDGDHFLVPKVLDN